MRIRLSLPLALSLLSCCVACSRTGEISGDVFVVAGGTPTPGAGAEIRVIPAAGGFQAELEKIIENFDAEFAEASKAHEKQKAIEDEAMKDPATLRKVDELVKKELSKIKKRLLPKQEEGFRMVVMSELGLSSFPAYLRLLDIKDRHEKRLQELVRTSEARAVLADINGRYEVSHLPAGPYYLSASIGSRYAWLVPVQIVPGGQKVHLSNANAGWLVHLTNAERTKWLQHVSGTAP
jgi:hypothetical protein